MTTAVVRLLGYSLVDSKLAYVDRFKDKDEIWTGFIPYVSIAVEKGIISGYKDNTFRPKIPVSRAEAAYIIWKAYGEGAKLQAYEPSGVNPQVKKFEGDWNTIGSDELSIALSFADSSNGSITFFSEGEGITRPFTYFQNKTDSIVIHLEENEKTTNMILALQDDNTVNLEVVLGDTYTLKRVTANGDSTNSAAENPLDLKAFEGEWWDKDKVFGFEIKATGPDSGTIEYIDRFSITELFTVVSSNAKSIVIQIGDSKKVVSLTLFSQDTLMYIDGMFTFDMSRK
ncbi:S-layer homology domain-containing protein [Paenibacillus mesotrionivorans]|uniref:S-layer homology domain-containing protein n=1 Tax=Paenibacillus mesotrionivorans TaxID=3160968 RepID=A0ACC7NYD7_9BACL